MSVIDHRGNRPVTPQSIDSTRHEALGRHPYLATLAVITAAMLAVHVLTAAVGFPPLVILGGAAGACLTVFGKYPGILALLLAVLISDFLFIEPVGKLTGASFVLGAYYGAAAIASRFLRKAYALK